MQFIFKFIQHKYGSDRLIAVQSKLSGSDSPNAITWPPSVHSCDTNKQSRGIITQLHHLHYHLLE